MDWRPDEGDAEEAEEDHAALHSGFATATAGRRGKRLGLWKGFGIVGGGFRFLKREGTRRRVNRGGGALRVGVVCSWSGGAWRTAFSGVLQVAPSDVSLVAVLLSWL